MFIVIKLNLVDDIFIRITQCWPQYRLPCSCSHHNVLFWGGTAVWRVYNQSVSFNFRSICNCSTPLHTSFVLAVGITKLSNEWLPLKPILTEFQPLSSPTLTTKLGQVFSCFLFLCTPEDTAEDGIIKNKETTYQWRQNCSFGSPKTIMPNLASTRMIPFLNGSANRLFIYWSILFWCVQVRTNVCS